MSSGGSQQRAPAELGPHLDGLARALGTAKDRGGVPCSDVGGNTAGLTRGDAAERIRCSKGRQVSSRCRPAGQHCRLGQHQHDGHGRHDHKGQPCGQDCARTAFAAVVPSRPAPAHGGVAPPGDRVAPSGIGYHFSPWPCVEPPRAPVPLLTPVPAVSLRIDARAVRVHGMDAPNGPGTRSVTVTLNHSPSAATDAAAEPPASTRTVRSTAAGSSPRASALAPALAPSSMRSCVIPAAAPASSMASKASTAGSATANSAVTAPRRFAPVSAVFWSLPPRALPPMATGRGRQRRGPAGVGVTAAPVLCG